MSVQVPFWTIQIKRGVDYNATLTFRSDGELFSFDEASLIINPQNGGQVEWTQANGKFTNTSLGIYAVAVDASETDGYSWSFATWRLQVVRDGEPNSSFMSGRVFVS